MYINLENHYFISDVSVLGNVHTLNLSGCILTDVRAENVHTLDLSRCKNIDDVSALRNVYNLDLSETSKISLNISCLTFKLILYINE